MPPRQYIGRVQNFTPLPFGLLSSLGDRIQTPSEPHWQSGVTYEPLCTATKSATGTTYEECYAVTGSGISPAIPPPSKVATGGLGERGATSFTVYAEVDCSAPGFWDRAEAIVSEMLTQSEQWQVERALWTGIAAGQPVVFPHLAANASVADTTGAVLQTVATQVSGGATFDVVEGIGALEAALADCYDGVGVLHVPRILAPALAHYGLLIQEGPRYRTPNGNIVVLGAGYRGTGPDGSTTDGAVWVYATGAVFIYRSTPTVFPRGTTLDRSENSMEALAERTYLVGWDCCHHGVKISTGGVITGGFGSSGA